MKAGTANLAHVKKTRGAILKKIIDRISIGIDQTKNKLLSCTPQSEQKKALFSQTADPEKYKLTAKSKSEKPAIIPDTILWFILLKYETANTNDHTN